MCGVLNFEQMAALGARRAWPLSMMQRFGVERNSGAPLEDDGIAGPKTRGAIFISPEDMAHPLTLAMAEYAQLGAREEGGNNRGRWPAHFMRDPDVAPLTPCAVGALELAEIQRLSRVQQGPSCAGTVERVILAAYGPGMPRSLGAIELARLWSVKPGESVKLGDAREGDLIAWSRDGGGHIGIVVGATAELLLVLEGNGARRGGAVGLYGYTLADGAARGRAKDHKVMRIARRPR